MLPSEKDQLSPSMPDSYVTRIWPALIVAVLAGSWCVLDSWNHDMSAELFRTSEVKSFSAEHGTIMRELEPFKYTLTLAFLQFSFAGVVFCAIFATKAAVGTTNSHKSLPDQTVGHIRSAFSNWQCAALVSTHTFSSLLLQSLMMPTHMMSLGFFASTRAIEVPVAAGVRSKLFGAHSNGPSAHTTLLMATSAFLLFYSYTQIAECLCVWSGFGVALTGLPLYFMYALLLTIPATHAVVQESMLVQLQVDPLLIQAIQNLCAAAILGPLLIAAHALGFEDVLHALAMITGQREVNMTVLWLCIQTTAIAAITSGLILMTDSFWTVAARALRVVFWWGRQLVAFYMTSNTLLSVARPYASAWSFVMLCGLLVAFGAVLSDVRKADNKLEEERSLLAPQGFLTGQCGTFKHV